MVADDHSNHTLMKMCGVLNCVLHDWVWMLGDVVLILSWKFLEVLETGFWLSEGCFPCLLGCSSSESVQSVRWQRVNEMGEVETGEEGCGVDGRHFSLLITLSADQQPSHSFQINNIHTHYSLLIKITQLWTSSNLW